MIDKTRPGWQPTGPTEEDHPLVDLESCVRCRVLTFNRIVSMPVSALLGISTMS